MFQVKDPRLRTVEEVVCSNTGMTADELLCDQKDYRIDGLNTAAAMLKEAIGKGQTIYIAGDYDVDGIFATALLALALKALNANMVLRLPKRFTEGYGLKREMVDRFRDGQFLITVDNGISALDAVRRAREKGMEVIVTDHHLPIVEEQTGNVHYPEANLIIDPNAVPSSADFVGYCGAGIAFRLAVELLGKAHPLVPRLLSFAAVATIADSVPLIGENRRIVKEGLKTITTREGTTQGLFALLCTLGLEEYITAEKVSFQLAPVINAPGRLRDNGSMEVLKLMLYDGPFSKAKVMAERFVEDNRERRSLSDVWTEHVRKTVIERNMHGHVPIVIYEPDIPEGVIGIVAGRVAETFKTPCILLGQSVRPGVLKGSGRSYGDIHLKNLLDENRTCLIKYGGHGPAVGLSLEHKDLEIFRLSLLKGLSGKECRKECKDMYDLRIQEDDIGKVMEAVTAFGPYGEGNPAPVFLLENLTLFPVGQTFYRYMQEGKGVKLFSPQLEAVSFHGGKEYQRMGTPRHVTLLGTLTASYFMGKIRHQMEIRKLLPCNPMQNRSPLLCALEAEAKERYVQSNQIRKEIYG